MSADNEICVASFPTTDGNKEYRVAHVQAIDNVFEQETEALNDLWRVFIFKRADVKVFNNREKAILFAHEYAKEFPVLEYGVTELNFDRPLLPLSYKEADDKIFGLISDNFDEAFDDGDDNDDNDWGEDVNGVNGD